MRTVAQLPGPGWRGRGLAKRFQQEDWDCLGLPRQAQGSSVSPLSLLLPVMTATDTACFSSTSLQVVDHLPPVAPENLKPFSRRFL